MSDKKVTPRFQTGPVELRYINCLSPDDKYNKENPMCQATAVLDPVAGKALVKEIESHFNGLKLNLQRDDDDNYLFKAKQRKFISWTKDGKQVTAEFTPVLLMADNTKYEGTRDPWGGSIGELAFTAREMKGERKGITLCLSGIRFHKIVEGTGENPEGSGDSLFGNTMTFIEPGEKPTMVEVEDDDVPFN